MYLFYPFCISIYAFKKPLLGEAGADIRTQYLPAH